MGVICVLPARLSSTRIPDKPLQEIAGRTLLEWSWRAAVRVTEFERVVIATDAPQIEERARGFDAEVLLTSAEHRSGTDRVEEAARRLGAGDDDVVTNFQADEPFVDEAAVSAAVRVVKRAGGSGPDVATIAAPIRDLDEWRSPGVVKVVCAADGSALYFSRAPVPFVREGRPRFEPAPGAFLRHVGVYACTRAALRRWADLPESALERLERLEQLRALEAGLRFHVTLGPWTEPGIDLPADVARAERILSGRSAKGGVPAP